MSARTLQESKRRKQQLRRRRRIIAYSMRLLVSTVLVLIIVLIFLGCRYIYDLFSDHGVKSEAAQLSASDEGPEADSPHQVLTDYTGYTVVLDAGHGGQDVGTMPDGNKTDLYEKDINLSIALLVRDYLEAQGVEVVMTREDDTFLQLSERTAISNQEAPDLFISLHCNYYEDDSSIRGLECYYAPKSSVGMECAETILDSITESGNVITRNAKSAEYYVLQHTIAPAVLIEMGYLSNRSDVKDLISEDYQQLLAQDLANGILEVLSELG